MVLDVCKKKEDQIQAAVERIQGIADNINQEMMLKMARGNYDAMVKTLQGYLVWENRRFSRRAWLT